MCQLWYLSVYVLMWIYIAHMYIFTNIHICIVFNYPSLLSMSFSSLVYQSSSSHAFLIHNRHLRFLYCLLCNQMYPFTMYTYTFYKYILDKLTSFNTRLPCELSVYQSLKWMDFLCQLIVGLWLYFFCCFCCCRCFWFCWLCCG